MTTELETVALRGAARTVEDDELEGPRLLARIGVVGLGDRELVITRSGYCDRGFEGDRVPVELRNDGESHFTGNGKGGPVVLDILIVNPVHRDHGLGWTGEREHQREDAEEEHRERTIHELTLRFQSRKLRGKATHFAGD
ncbi:MAG: hypothetical protein VCA73_14995 [Roseibacillus sp.]